MSSVSKPRVRHNRHKQGLNLTLEKLSADFRLIITIFVTVSGKYRWQTYLDESVFVLSLQEIW